MSALDDVMAALSRLAPTCNSELDLQAAVGRLLDASGIANTPEADIGTGRIDFLAGAVGIECKVDGAPAAVARQVLRYCGSGRCDDGVLLVTTKASHRAIRGINSFPIRVLVLVGGLS